MNQLHGVPRAAAQAWLVDARAVLEARQALAVCRAHAALAAAAATAAAAPGTPL